MMRTISATKAKWILRKYLKSRIFWSQKILLFDNQYELVNESTLNLTPVQLGGGDCDDRAWVSMAHTMKAYIMMGEVLEQRPNILFGFSEGYDRRGLKHAWVFFISQEGNQVKFAEPSTAEIFLPTTERIHHFIR